MPPKKRLSVHSIRIHGFPAIEIKVAEIWCDLLCVIGLDFLLELFDLLFIRAAFLELLHDLLQIA